MSKKKVQAEERAIVPVVSLINNQILTTSLNVAEVFNKPHHNVLKAVRALDIPSEFSEVNFHAANYTDYQGKQRPMVNLTRDGFTLLAMGFTGQKAFKFKLAYIETFNRMEAELRQKDKAEPRAAIESAPPDPARLAESLMQALIASLSGSHNDKIDDLGCEIVSRLEDLSGRVGDLTGQEDLTPMLHILNSNVSNLRRQMVNMLPKIAIPDDLVEGLRTVAARLTAIADQQDNRDFAFHERLRALEMLFRGVELKQAMNLIGDQPGVWDYIEGNTPPSLRHKFNMTLVPKAAGSSMLLRFMKECLIPDLDSRIELQRLYPLYCAWCYANMNSPVTLTTYKKLLKEFVTKFQGMRIKMDNYVQYLQGAQVRIPRSAPPAGKNAAALPETTADPTLNVEASNETFDPGVAPQTTDPATGSIAEPPTAGPQPRRFKDFAVRIFGGKGGE